MENERMERLKADLRKAGYEVGEDDDIHVVDVDMAGEAGHEILKALMKQTLGVDVDNPGQVSQFMAGQNIELATLLVDRAMHLKRQVGVLQSGKEGITRWVTAKDVRTAGAHMLIAAKRLMQSCVPEDAENRALQDESIEMLNGMIRDF